MPQPLSSYIKKGDQYSLSTGGDELKKRPHLAARVAELIGIASGIDHGMAIILANLLHASPEPAFAMFTEIMDAGNKRAMILAAARAALKPEDFESFEVVSAVVRSQIDVRNKFAHWIWGACEQVPDALLLVDPRYLLGHARHLQKVWTEDATEQDASAAHEKRMAAISYDFDRIYVYRTTDFDQCLRDITETQAMVDEFASMFNPQLRSLEEGLAVAFPNSPRRNFYDEAKSRLGKRRLFSEALERLRTRRSKSSL
ncbi:hypothetical protein AMC87_CH00571 [Rhizobium phaseoli]|uniref:hypothetical protein n=1 Tax=Rhizobium phaseoli TaxID=396 RepID=UPI0007E9AC5E|nr:hypothetical protein [Rhizobium phaseoli]ANL45305.1 hypothetical protein AMC87_CH00571 [Rhizobium phaseoli]PDS33330.1 hypothetical protein CO650_00895 [Rhizobium phaseoli]